MTTWKARPTTYKGIPMRSRLEAHVAAMLDETGHPWEYEPRAFANETGQYLPDFLLMPPSGARIYIEAKPTVEAALAVMPRMQIIWDSEPLAYLSIVVGDSWLIATAEIHDRTWRW